MQSELSWHVLGVITRKDSAGACFFQRFGRYGAFHGRSIAACGHMKQGWLSKGELDEFRSVLTARTAEVKVVHHCTCAAPSATLMLSTHSYSLLTAPVFAQHADNASTPQLAASCAAKATPLDKTLDTGHTYTLAAELSASAWRLSTMPRFIQFLFPRRVPHYAPVLRCARVPSLKTESGICS